MPSLLFLKQFALLIRLPNTFTVISNILAAHIISTQGQIAPLPLILTIIASFLFYHGGMVMNDCLDYQEDLIHRPKRPLPNGFMPLKAAWFMSVGMIIVALVLCAFINAATLIVAVSLTITIALYNFTSREALIGCFWMGACRSLNWLLALAACGALTEYWPYSVVVGAYVLALTLISRDETQAKNKAYVYSCIAIIVASVCAFLWFAVNSYDVSWAALSMVFAALAMVIVQASKLLASYSPEKIQKMVMFLVLGLIPLDALLVLLSGFPIEALVVVSLFIPGKLLAKKLYVT